jgi:hypothetical protein
VPALLIDSHIELRNSTRDSGPPAFLGPDVGDRIDELAGVSEVRSVARTIATPRLTIRLMRADPLFNGLTEQELADAANNLTFVFRHQQRWRLHWVESVPGPAQFSDTRRVEVGVTHEAATELTKAVKGSAKVNIFTVAVDASAEWTKVTRSTVNIVLTQESTRNVTYDVPEPGMDIALWQLESILSRSMALRPNEHVRADVPRWIERALQHGDRSVVVPTTTTRIMVRR